MRERDEWWLSAWPVELQAGGGRVRAVPVDGRQGDVPAPIHQRHAAAGEAWQALQAMLKQARAWAEGPGLRGRAGGGEAWAVSARRYRFSGGGSEDGLAETDVLWEGQKVLFTPAAGRGVHVLDGSEWAEEEVGRDLYREAGAGSSGWFVGEREVELRRYGRREERVRACELDSWEGGGAEPGWRRFTDEGEARAAYADLLARRQARGCGGRCWKVWIERRAAADCFAHTKWILGVGDSRQAVTFAPSSSGDTVALGGEEWDTETVESRLL